MPFGRILLQPFNPGHGPSPWSSRFRELALEHLDCALVCGFGHLAERSDLVVRQYPFEVGLGFADQSFEFANLVGADRAIGTRVP